MKSHGRSQGRCICGQSEGIQMAIKILSSICGSFLTFMINIVKLTKTTVLASFINNMMKMLSETEALKAIRS